MNRDVDWTCALEKKPSDHRIRALLALDENERSLVLPLTDEDGNSGRAHQALRAILFEPVPQAGQGRDRYAGLVQGQSLTTHR